jgi:hypothetical protein
MQSRTRVTGKGGGEAAGAHQQQQEEEEGCIGGASRCRHLNENSETAARLKEIKWRRCSRTEQKRTA